MAIKYATLHRKNSSSYDAIYPKTHTDQIENLSTLLNAITIDSIGDIDDVVVNSPSEDEGLFYNGDNWVNGTVENILADKTIPGSLTFWHGTSNTAKFKVNIDVLGSPQMEFSDHNNDLYWAFGADDTSTPSNSFKIHGSTSAMPTINGLANPMFEVTQTSGDVRIAGNRIYHVGYKPSWSDLQGSQPAPISHYAHPYIGFSSGTPSTTAGNLIYYDGKLYLGNGSSIGTLYTTTNKPTPADIAAIAKSGISLNNTHDLNNYNTEGERYWWGSSVPTNAPTSYGYMFVSYNNQPQQVVYGGYPAGSEGIWIRRKHSGTWSSWIQMYSPNNKPSASDVGAMSTSHPANAITAQNISDWAQTTDIVGEHNSEWDDAYSWGDHAGLYLGLTAKAADSDKLDGTDGADYFKNNDIVMSHNSFGGRRLYISHLDNVLFLANERWTVTNGHSTLFNGDYDGYLSVPINTTKVIDINFGGDWPSYGYGDIYVSFYYTGGPDTITGRVYCNYSGHGIGWHDLTFTKITSESSGRFIYKASQNYHDISQIEITVTAGSSLDAKITQIEWVLNRPTVSHEMPFVNKFRNQNLYKDFDWVSGTVKIDGDEIFHPGNPQTQVVGSLIGRVYAGSTGAPDNWIFSVSEQYNNWGMRYNEGSPDRIEFVSSDNTKATIALDTGDIYSAGDIEAASQIFVGTGDKKTDRTMHLTNAGASLRVGPAYTSGGDRDYIDILSGGTDSAILTSNDGVFKLWNIDTSSGGLSLGTNNTERIHILKDGNVGIGTDNPGHVLDVYGDMGIRDGYKIYTHGSSNYIDYRTWMVSTSGTVQIMNAGSGDMQFGTNNKDRFTITNAGELEYYSGETTNRFSMGRSSTQRFEMYVTDMAGYINYHQDEASGDHSVYFGITSPTVTEKKFVFNEHLYEGASRVYSPNNKPSLSDITNSANLTAALNVATTSLQGAMSAQDKSNLDTLTNLLSTDDADTIIDTIGEVLQFFETMSEGVNLVQVLSAYAPLASPVFTGNPEAPELLLQQSGKTHLLHLDSNNVNQGLLGIKFTGHATTSGQEGYFEATHLDSESEGGNYSFHFKSTEATPNVILHGAGNYKIKNGASVYNVLHTGNFISGTDYAPAHTHPYMSTSHPANAITAQNISDWAQTTDIVGEHNSEWDDAYSWGDHAGLYLGLTAKAADSDKLDGLDSSVFLNNTAVNHSASNLAVGWYTIATNAGDRAIARFGLRDTNSGDHQSVVFYASHHFGRNSDITVWHNSKYSGSPLQKIRIKEGGTYDGAMLQVYIDDATNNVVAYLLGDNFQSNGWVLKDWVPDGTNPGGVNNFAALTNTAAEVDLGLALGGIQSTGDFVSNGQTLVKTNDSRLSDARTPTSHSHLIADLPSDIVVDGDVAATNTASKIVKRDGNGYVFATIFNSTFSGNNTSVAHVMTKNASDDYIRPTAIADFKTSLGSMPASDVSAWAKEASKPSYNYSEISGSVPHDDLPWAGSTTKGGVKLVVSGTTLYIYSS